MFSRLVDKLQGWLDALVLMLPNLAVALLIFVAFWLASIYVRRIVARVLDRLSQHKALTQLTATIVRIGVIVAGAIIALQLLHLDKAVTTFLAGAGIIGLAIGFAFQDISANFIAGITLAVRQPVRVGDLIESEGHQGTIRRIDLRSSTIETPDGKRIHIANRNLLSNPIINYTDLGVRRVEVTIGVAYDDDLPRVRQLVLDAMESVAHCQDRPLEVFYIGFGDSSIDFTLRFWIPFTRAVQYMEARSNAIMAVKKAFDENGIDIPFPIRTLDFAADKVGGERFSLDREAA